MRSLSALLLLAALPACNCGRPPAGPDAGFPRGKPCETETDCALGESCVEGFCGEPVVPDAGGQACTTNADCDPGKVCVPSTGLCIALVVQDAGTEDGGQTGTCFEGQAQSCGSSKLGECTLGMSTCTVQDGVWSYGPCLGAVNPLPEVCNGKDDDCDGFGDDGLGSTTCGQGSCARTVDNCVGGQNQTCAPGPSSAEVCDGLDNDCNGTSDDGIAQLSCGVGACARTVPACAAGVPQTCLPGPTAAETCNGLDDDCDGQSDEDLGQTSCGLGICRRTVELCVGGVPQTCTPGPSSAELCNGIDDSCNGTIDEGCNCTIGQTQPCYTGPAGTQGVGRCVPGTQSCAAGQWGPCGGEVTPGTETCNSIDDNCSGAADEGLGQTSCGVGACRRTVSNCVGGATQTCTPGTAGAEVCNAIDDDCNGQTDEGLGTVSCGVGACRNTIQVCVGGVTQACTPGTPGLEICNGVDDNCNGGTDETFPQQGQSCPTGLPGLCGNGGFGCPSGTLSCTQTVFPVAEVCNDGLDQNCNGTIDDPSACGCNSSTDGDLDGSNECLDCNDNDGTIRPGAAETCNGKDDNCNGQIDETFDQDGDGFTTCGTRPGGGLEPTRIDCNDTNAFVFPLKVADCGGAASPATPNGVDDNCNGYLDETCACSGTDRDGDGVDTCQGDCNDNDATVRPGATELCDGKDNDCKKTTVDNCGVSDPCGYRQGNNWYRWPAGTDQCRPDLLCVTNVATGALTCGSFCNQSLGVGLNDSCAVGEGCNRNLIDSDNLHLCSVTPTGTKTTGQTCGVASECRSGDCLTEGTAKYCSDRCTHEAGCSNNTTCFVGRGPLGGPPVPSGYYYYSYCKLDSNITGTRTLGQSCSATSECRTGTYGCFNSACIEPCCQNSECGAGYACSINGPKVATGYQSGGVPIWSLMPSCLASGATRISGQVCTASSQCKSGLCDDVRGICVDVCCNDASCPNGTSCEMVSLLLSSGQQTTVRACMFLPVPTQLEQR